MNTWPNGHRHAMSQAGHERWNATHYPGTRQCCCKCDVPTERCEDDALHVGDSGPLCPECFHAADAAEGSEG